VLDILQLVILRSSRFLGKVLLSMFVKTAVDLLPT